MNVLVADDHHIILQGLHEYLSKNLTDVVIYQAADLTTLNATLAAQPIDLLIQDIRFGKDTALDFIPEILKHHPLLRIIALTSVSDANTITKLKKQISGYVLKGESLDEILIAINAVAAGDEYWSEGTLKRLSSFPTSEEIILTKREREVLEVILQEKSNKEISEILFISEKTVEMHRSNLFVKLDVKNVVGLVKKVIALDLLSE